MRESKLQTEIKKYLKSKGCIVLVTSPSPGIPNGFPDILFLTEGFYGAIEVKKSKDADFQPLQEYFVGKLNEFSWAEVVYPENWDEIKKELDSLLRK